MSHPTTIRHALWDTLRTFYRDFRRAVATSKEHGGPALVVELPASEIETALGEAYFAPNWEFSYHERGEDMNLARVGYDHRRVSGHTYEWWQTHVRGWEYRVDGRVHTRLRPHYELEPTEYDQDHINGVGVSIDTGVDAVASELDDADIAYDRYDELPPGEP